MNNKFKELYELGETCFLNKYGWVLYYKGYIKKEWIEKNMCYEKMVVSKEEALNNVFNNYDSSTISNRRY